MARSTLQAFVSGVRQMLTLQLVIGVAAVGLAGWTATVTNQLIRERNALQTRVLQLEEHIDKLGGESPASLSGEASPTLEAPPMPEAETPTTVPADGEKPPTQTTPGAETAPTPTTATTAPAFDPGRFIHDVFTPAPPLQMLVLHVRADADRQRAERIARELGANGFKVSIDVMAPRDQRASGYAFFDVRQAQPAAAIAGQVQEAARHAEIEPWVVQLNGVALPGNAEYTANRVDFVLPPLPAPTRIDPRALEQRR